MQHLGNAFSEQKKKKSKKYLQHLITGLGFEIF